jgi:hypothetical protein
MATRADPLASGAVGGRDGQFVLVEWSDPGGITTRERPIAGLRTPTGTRVPRRRGTCS